MRIVLTGGGTGGHFYPLIAVAEAIREISYEEKIIDPAIYYIGPDKYDPTALEEQGIKFLQSPAGKWRKYASHKNFLDIFRTGFGIIKAIFQLYFLYPDVILSKGGYASFPTTVAARLLRIPLVVHESDASVGKANRISSKWARAIGISYPNIENQFRGVAKEKFAYVGNPIRSSLWRPETAGAHEFLDLDKNIPTILILGGSQGASAINQAVLNILPWLVERYQVIHQTGVENYSEISSLAKVILENNENASRYKSFGFLTALALRMSSGVASLVIARAGSGTIFEIAAWGLPSLIIPIPEDISQDQTKNAFAYAREGACLVVVQQNLTPNLLQNEIERIMNDVNLREKMSVSAKEFAKPEAAEKLAKLLLSVALEHE